MLFNKFLSRVKEIGNSFLDLAYPPSCLHCREKSVDSSKILCPPCEDLLTLSDAHHRCRYCYQEVGEHLTICKRCQTGRFSFTSCAAVWEFFGPPRTLITTLKNGKQPTLAKVIAAYLVTKWHTLGWPIPDVIIPVPYFWTQLFFKNGVDAAASIAKHAAEMLGRPCLQPLRKTNGNFSQAKLPLTQRMALDSASFRLVSKHSLVNTTILLIDDYFMTRSTFHCCAEALVEAFPKSIYALAAGYEAV